MRSMLKEEKEIKEKGGKSEGKGTATLSLSNHNLTFWTEPWQGPQY